jgi:hypothetical protein
MHQRAIIMSVILFVLVVVGMFVFTYLKRGELATIDETPIVTKTEVTPYDHITRVDAKHFFIDGVHTLVGEIPMPTPCDLVDSSALVAESFPEQVTIDFNIINNADSCVQVVTDQRFKVSFNASSGASISARLNGRAIELNLIPAGEGESPDDFELYIKG